MTTSGTIRTALTALATLLLTLTTSIAQDTRPVDEVVTGPLSPQEEKFQGDWKAYGFKSNRLEYAMTFEGRDFHARARPDDKDRDEWYEGYIVIRTDLEPAQIDFVILVQSGEPGLRISEGIFYFDGETVIVKAPEHGEPRPRDFKSDDKNTPTAFLRLSRDG